MDRAERVLSGACVATSLMAMASVPDSTIPIVNAVSGVVFMAAAFLFWSD